MRGEKGFSVNYTQKNSKLINSIQIVKYFYAKNSILLCIKIFHVNYHNKKNILDNKIRKQFRCFYKFAFKQYILRHFFN